jgi:hypothetical protein
MRGRLINPFLAEIAQLDTVATGADPDGPAPLTSGYDDDFKETVVVSTSSQLRTDARKEKPLLRIPCQVEVSTLETLEQLGAGASPHSRLTLVFHFEHLEQSGLIDGATGTARLRVNDRLVAIYSCDGGLVHSVRTPPGLYAIEVQPQSFGMGLSRNLLLVTFQERAVAARGAA